MSENRYQKFIRLITKNNLSILRKPTYDPQSGWGGEEILVYDGETRITDLSGNGFCFNDGNVDKSISDIEKYLENKNMNSLEALKDWIDSNSTLVR